VPGIGLAIMHGARAAIKIHAPEAPLRRADIPWLAAVILFQRHPRTVAVDARALPHRCGVQLAAAQSERPRDDGDRVARMWISVFC